MSLSGSVAVVTGGGSGIGRAVADQLRTEGMLVVAGDLAPPGHQAKLVGVGCDVREEEDVQHLIQIAKELGTVKVLVTCAGVTHKAKVTELDIDDWNRILAINLTGTMLPIKYAVREMSAHGKGGAIVSVSSIAASMTSSAYNSAYAASKGGVASMTRALVHELSPLGIRINAVAPGVIRSPMTDSFGSEWADSRALTIPLGRLGEPEEIARFIAYLAGDGASFITGQVYAVDGGSSAIILPPPLS